MLLDAGVCVDSMEGFKKGNEKYFNKVHPNYKYNKNDNLIKRFIRKIPTEFLDLLIQHYVQDNNKEKIKRIVAILFDNDDDSLIKKYESFIKLSYN